jgi:hypothetical protein
LVTFHRSAFVSRYVGEKACPTLQALLNLLLRLLDPRLSPVDGVFFLRMLSQKIDSSPSES